MTTTFDFFATTRSACGRAVVQFFEPLLLLRPLRRPPPSLSRKRGYHRIDSLLGEDTNFVGDVSCKEKGIRIDGHWAGNITCVGGTVIVSSIASLEGDLNTEFAVINGSIRGNVVATGAVEIQSEARIDGNVYAPVVEMHSGAMVRGQIETSETPGSDTFLALRGTVREIADQAPKVRLVK